MTRNIRCTLAGVTALAALATGTALAAEPESGTVSFASPKTQWTGTVMNSYVNRLPIVLEVDEEFPCLPEMCDSFALEVADSSNLTLGVNAPATSDGSPASVSMRITAPDDTVTVSTGEATPDKPHKLTIKNAKTGGYTIDYFNNLVGTPGEYTGTAELAVPTAEPPATPPPGAPPAEAFTLDVKAGAASARKLNRSKRFSARVTVSREVQSAVAVLKKGSRTVGQGKLGAFSGTKTLKLKLSRKLKAGSYRLGVEATDSAGTRVGKTVTVKVRR